jgi:hypothetical protein
MLIVTMSARQLPRPHTAALLFVELKRMRPF